MGFEQLAELKKQLAAAARAEAAPAAKQGAKSGARPSRPGVSAGNQPKQGARPVAKAGDQQGARPARKPAPPRGEAQTADAPAKPAQARPVDAKPVDPVVKSIGRLQKRFPVAFPKNPAPKLPLKVGIFEDLVVHAKELSLSEAELRDAIKTWCRGSRYWKCLVEGAARVDLTGTEAGTVTAQEAAGAQRLQAHRAGRGAQKGGQKAGSPKDAAPADSAGTADTAGSVEVAPVQASAEADAGEQAGSLEAVEPGKVVSPDVKPEATESAASSTSSTSSSSPSSPSSVEPVATPTPEAQS
ncbi:ProQ/FinO family protein [Paraburkholderia sp. BCC1886]|uniref:ProQ/FinO family protein n=1 Tax=Paraburkholderia sp. BCC1886 TaxID=2562670 RepID=UPI001184610C|nr:ProQ/FinO family protein [Paraburkholderia sp. BCC1886]